MSFNNFSEEVENNVDEATTVTESSDKDEGRNLTRRRMIVKPFSLVKSKARTFPNWYCNKQNTLLKKQFR